MTDENRNPTPGTPAPQGQAPAPGPAAAQPVVPPAAAKPAAPSPAPAKAAADMTRRGFLSTLGVAWTAFAAACGAGAIATTRFMFPNVLFEPPQQFKAGFPSDFLVGTVDQRFKESFGAWIVRNEQEIYVLRTVCTHLGCTPNWLEAENKFKCPCHGSGFYRSGINYEGPAPRPLERYRIVLADDGQILIDKTKIYAYEKGEWENPESFLKV
ncbi:MAG TPA: Rieske 2Fe-2S domain-containing protein [Candidatus Polarisedimenticolia bacterium]|nr:Rieske 2Fe-2S domain-containing protein [Candidatus Polarisedimenticolia bacterium]